MPEMNGVVGHEDLFQAEFHTDEIGGFTGQIFYIGKFLHQETLGRFHLLGVLDERGGGGAFNILQLL